MKRAVLVAALFFSPAHAIGKTPVKPAAGVKVAATPTPRPPSVLENHQDLILKAQNLTLQRDRLQTSQILIRAIQRENKGSAAYKDLTKALDELTSVFYTEKAQSVFAVGEAAAELKPREAIDSFQEALRVEDGNVSILKALARAQLVLGDCEKADATVRLAEGIDPYSPEVKLLSLQSLACAKSFDAILTKLESPDPDFDNADAFVKSVRTGLQVQAMIGAAKPKSDLKKIRTTLANWESGASDDPEVYFWKWEFSKLQNSPDRTAAVKYAQACQNLSPRKRKSYSLDVNLCKGKDGVEAYLKTSGLTSSPKSSDAQE